MRLAMVVGTTLTGFLLAGCQHSPVNRLLGMDDSRSEAAAPAPVAAPPAATPTPAPTTALPRFETYRFIGTVRPGGNGYHKTVAAGDAVSGTFQIDFEQPVYFSASGFQVYEALASIQGTVGGYPFSGTQNLIYVKPASSVPYWVDTGYLTLDGSSISFDLFFQLATGSFSDSSLQNLRSLDERSYSVVDLWFETDPRSGSGFNAQITSLQRADPLTLASARLSH